MGENKPIRVNVRIIAATNQDLLTAVAEKRFRQDLYYRLNVARFQLPRSASDAKTSRISCTYFLDKYARKMGVRPKLHDNVVESLMHYDFPGNIRELEHMIEQAVALDSDGRHHGRRRLARRADRPAFDVQLGGACPGRRGRCRGEDGHRRGAARERWEPRAGR